MTTLICPYCGCSLVRLGISEEKAATYIHDGTEYQFCCQGCVGLFTTDPEKYLLETSDLIVCPTCLAEKPLNSAVKLNIGEQQVHFCRCPYCAEVFQKKPAFYLDRLKGMTPHEGVLDHDGCCVRPD